MKTTYGLPVLTDLHRVEEAGVVGQVVDVVQIPALLYRQTDIIKAACDSGAEVNIKKGQFLSPEESLLLYQKALEFNPKKVYICERGSSFGYHHLVNDFKSVRFLLNHEVPVVFDATHSVQLPGGLGSSTGGQREYVESLARAAAIIGVKNFFFETHPTPEKAISDGPNMVPLAQLEAVLINIKKIADFESTLLNVHLSH